MKDPCLRCDRPLTFEPHPLGVAAFCELCRTELGGEASLGPIEASAAEAWNSRWTLRWEYCECGCKCFVAEGTRFHVYWDLGSRWYLWEGRFRDKQEVFYSNEEAKKEARKRFARREGTP